MKADIYKKVPITIEESNFLLKLLLKERNKLIINGKYTDTIDEILLNNYKELK